MSYAISLETDLMESDTVQHVDHGMNGYAQQLTN